MYRTFEILKKILIIIIIIIIIIITIIIITTIIIKRIKYVQYNRPISPKCKYFHCFSFAI